MLFINVNAAATSSRMKWRWCYTHVRTHVYGRTDARKKNAPVLGTTKATVRFERQTPGRFCALSFVYRPRRRQQWSPGGFIESKSLSLFINNTTKE